jgi:ubiquitin-conjugating enzyme E2 variant
MRRVELASITVFLLLAGTQVARLDLGGSLAVAALSAWLTADLLSGLVHWALDTFGSVRTPLVGPAFIRPFREHHADAQAITRHDFVETNGASCLGALPLLFGAAAVPPGLLHGFLVFTALGALAANQCHKWAHSEAEQLPRAVRALQCMGLILRPSRHARHHASPFDRDYCTAAGWLNGPLNAILGRRT